MTTTPEPLAVLATHAPARDPLSLPALAVPLATLGAGWSVVDGQLRLDLRGPMTRTGAVAAFAGALADELDHHPTITLTYPGLHLAIDTHDHTGPAGTRAITQLDLIFAARLERFLRRLA